MLRNKHFWARISFTCSILENSLNLMAKENRKIACSSLDQVLFDKNGYKNYNI